MTIRLRPHHLLCLLTYVGKGYTPSFTVNYDLIAVRLSQGEDIELVQGPDDVCAPLLLESEPHCRRDSVSERDRKATIDLADLGISVEGAMNFKLDADLLAQMRLSFARGITRSACAGCQWNDLCSSVAAGNFNGTRIQIGPS